MNSPAMILRKSCDTLFGVAGFIAFTILFILKFSFIENNFWVNIASNLTTALNWLGWTVALTSVQYALAGLCMAGFCLVGVTLQMFFSKLLDMVFPSTVEVSP